MSATAAPNVPLLDLSEGAEAALAVLEQFLPTQAAEGLVLRGVDLDKSFGGVHAVSNVTVEVAANSVVGLIGPNGAGKSTLFNLLNGFELPDRGSVFLFDHNVTSVPPWTRAKLGMSRTFQASHVDVDQTVLDNLLSGAHLHIRGGLIGATFRSRRNWVSEERAIQAARAVARLLDLEPVLETPAGSLDFGAQRRTEIGRSLMSGPRLLLLDEPCAGLDVYEALEVMALVRRLQADLKLAVVVIEHFVEAVFEYCDLVYVLVQGAVVSLGTPDHVAADPRVRAAYLGNEG